MEIRRIAPDDATALRDIRLRALADSPEAFGSNYDREAAFPPEHWAERAERYASGTEDVIYLAFSGGRPIGMAGAYSPTPSVRGIWGMWVEPSRRGNGVGRRLVDELLAWAQAAGIDGVELWVVEGNDAAVALYESYGFAATGTTKPHANDPNLDEVHYRLSLR